MKKQKFLIYIVLIIIVLVAGVFIYKVFGQSKTEEDKSSEKTISEIKLFDNRFVNLFNQLNNISFENYKIISSNIEENSEGTSSEAQVDKSNETGQSKRITSEGSEQESSRNKENNLRPKKSKI